MGLFGKKHTAVNLGDRVWISKDKKYRHLLSDASDYVSRGKTVLLAYYFTDTFSWISENLKVKKIAFAELDNVRPELEDKINLVNAELFGTQYFLDKLSPGSRDVIIMFAEHYPLFKPENSLLCSIDNLGDHLSYCFYMSFDEPVMSKFGSDKILKMLEGLGMDKEEMISHPIISKAIENVQKKIESQVRFELRAYSLEEWFEKNLPSADIK